MMGNLSSSAIVETTAWSQYIPEETIREWQDIVELIVRLSGARSGLVMRVIEDSIQVCVSSRTENNPYRVGDSAHLIGSGLYCEMVIATQQPLLVPNALQSVEWRNNPDIEFNMISYLGVPIRWPCGKPFGTICVLDDKENAYSSDLLALLEKMRNLIEHHLQLKQARDVAEAANRALQSANAELDQRATTDSLTGAYNRRYFEQAAVAGIARAQRYDEPLSLLLCDIDHFKAVSNDSLTS
jgi:GAF domain-containing protein